MAIEVRKRQVQQQIIPGARMPDRSYEGSQEAARSYQTLSAGLEKVANVAGDLIDFKDEVEAKEAKNQLRKSLLTEKQNFILNRKGKGAVDSSKDFKDAAKLARTDALKGKNSFQQRIILEEMDPVIIGMELDMDKFEADEIENWSKQEDQAAINNEIQAAVLEKDDIVQMGINIDDAVAKTKKLMASQGFDANSEKTQEAVRLTKTKAYAGVINSLMSDYENATAIGKKQGYLQKAKGLYADWKTEMSSEAQVHYDALFKNVTKTQTYQEKAEDIYFKHSDKPPHVAYKAMIEEARKIEDAEEERAVKAVIDAMHTRDLRMEGERIDAATTETMNKMADTVKPPDGSIQLPGWETKLYEIASNSDPKIRSDMLKLAASYVKSGGVIKTDPVEYQRIKALPRKEFEDENIAANPKLSDSDKKKLIDEKSREQKTTNLTPSRSFSQKIKEAANLVDIDTGSKKDKDIEEYAEFANEVEQEVNDLEEATGKKATPDQQNEVINRKVIDYKLGKKGEAVGTKGFGLGKNMSYDKAVERGDENTWLPFVKDPELRAKIINEIEEQGLYQVNDTTIRLHARIFYMGLPSTSELHAEVKQYQKNTAVSNE